MTPQCATVLSFHQLTAQRRPQIWPRVTFASAPWTALLIKQWCPFVICRVRSFFFFLLRHQTHKLFIYFQLLQTCALRVTRRGRECRRTKKWGCPLDKSPVHHSHIKKKRKKKLPFTLCPGSDGNLNVSRFIRVRVLGLSGGSQRTRENPHKQREDIKKKKSDPEWNQRHAAVSCRIFLQF